MYSFFILLAWILIVGTVHGKERQIGVTVYCPFTKHTILYKNQNVLVALTRADKPNQVLWKSTDYKGKFYLDKKNDHYNMQVSLTLPNSKIAIANCTSLLKEIERHKTNFIDFEGDVSTQDCHEVNVPGVCLPASAPPQK